MIDILGSGVGPAPLSTPGGGLVTYPWESFQSPLLDLTVPNLGIELVPGRQNFIPLLVLFGWILEQISGTQVTPCVWTAGSDPAHSNLTSSSANPSNTDVNTNVVPSVATLGIGASNTLQRVPGLPTFLDVTAGAAGTGNFTLRAKLVVQIRWSPVG